MANPAQISRAAVPEWLTTPGLCLSCNYPLLNLPQPRCPECGRDFDPRDPATMNMGRPLPTWAVWALGPIRWPTRLFAAAAVAVALWSARLPGGYFTLRHSRSLLLLAVVIALWTLWPVIRWAIARRFNWRTWQLTGARHAGLRPARVAVPLLMGFCLAAVASRAPLRLSFRLSRPAMQSLVTQAAASKAQIPPRWVGLYKAKHVQNVPGGVKFTVEDSDVTYRAGFAYLPAVNPAHTSWRSLQYLGDGWWSWREEG